MLTWSILVALAIILSIISLWRMNSLFAITTFGAWMAAIAYHVSDRPTGIVAGDPVDVAILLIFAGVAIAIPFVAFGRSGRRTTGRILGVEGDELKERNNRTSAEEYRDSVKTALRRTNSRRR